MLRLTSVCGYGVGRYCYYSRKLRSCQQGKYGKCFRQVFNMVVINKESLPLEGRLCVPILLQYSIYTNIINIFI